MSPCSSRQDKKGAGRSTAQGTSFLLQVAGDQQVNQHVSSFLVYRPLSNDDSDNQPLGHDERTFQSRVDPGTKGHTVS